MSIVLIALAMYATAWVALALSERRTWIDGAGGGGGAGVLVAPASDNDAVERQAA